MIFDSWYRLRKIRNQYLKDTDVYMLSDFPVDTKTRGQYKDYRQYLRHLPKMYSEESINTAKVKSFEEYLDFRRNGDY